MIGLRSPSDVELAAFCAAQDAAGMSYPEVGATRTEPLPPGYAHDRRVEIVGAATAFERARRALQLWEVHTCAGVRISPIEMVREGLAVALVVRAGGLATTSACRVVYVIDEPDRFGFAYGTLADHAVAGEELFLVERRGAELAFELRAFSRARSLLFRMAAPIVRRKQLAIGAAYIAALRAILTAEGTS